MSERSTTQDGPSDILSAYLAGPGVFQPDPVAYGETLKAVCRKHRVRGVFPMDATLDLSGMSKAGAARAIKDANTGLIRATDVVIADVSPFRGPSADLGTGWEMGYAEGIGHAVFRHSSDPRPYLERVAGAAGGAKLDADGLSIEDFGLADNLMLAAGVEVHATLDEAVAAAVAWWRAEHPDAAE